MRRGGDLAALQKKKQSGERENLTVSCRAVKANPKEGEIGKASRKRRNKPSMTNRKYEKSSPASTRLGA